MMMIMIMMVTHYGDDYDYDDTESTTASRPATSANISSRAHNGSASIENISSPLAVCKRTRILAWHYRGQRASNAVAGIEPIVYIRSHSE